MDSIKKIDDSSFKKHIIKIIAIPVSLIFLLLLYSHFQISYINSLNDQVEKVDQLVLNTVKLEKIISDMGAGFRGFLLTQDKKFIVPYGQSAKSFSNIKENIFQKLDGKYEESKIFRNIITQFNSWKDTIERTVSNTILLTDKNADDSLPMEAQVKYKELKKLLSSFETRLLIIKSTNLRDLKRTKQTSRIFEAVYVIALIFILIVLLSREVKSATLSYRKILFENDRFFKELQDSVKSKDLFLANMSHEIRTPLGAVIGFCDLALEEKNTNSKIVDYLNFIKRNSDHLLTLVNDLFDISKITADKIDVTNNLINTSDFLEDIQNNFLHKLESKDQKIDIRIDSVTPSQFISDITRLKQILTNLIGNSIKFSPKGSTVICNVYYDEEFLSIDVIDNGIGIDKKMHSNIFETFTQENESHTRDYGGAGLGLAISKKLAQLLGGDLILVSSKKNKGSQFRLTVHAPGVENSQVEAEKIPTSSNKNSNLDHNLNSLKDKSILLAEDSKENQTLFRIFIESTGAKLTIVENGKDAIERIKSENFDLGILDIQMPILDGHETIKLIRSENIKTPFFALTAHTLKGEKEKCLKNGFDGFITKPVDKDTLIKAILDLL